MPDVKDNRCLIPVSYQQVSFNHFKPQASGYYDHYDESAPNLIKLSFQTKTIILTWKSYHVNVMPEPLSERKTLILICNSCKVQINLVIQD